MIVTILTRVGQTTKSHIYCLQVFSFHDYNWKDMKLIVPDLNFLFRRLSRFILYIKDGQMNARAFLHLCLHEENTHSF